MLELYTHPMSPCAQKVRIVLAEKGLEWTKHHVNLQQKENLKTEYLKLNPSLSRALSVSISKTPTRTCSCVRKAATNARRCVTG